MIPWNCRHVSWCLRPPWRGGGSSLLILESCEEAGERWSCWAWFSWAKLGKRGRGFTPPRPRPPPPRLRVHIFKQTYVVWEIERRRQNEGERWIQQDSEQKKKKKHPGTRWPGLWRHCCCHVMEDVHESVLVWFSVAVFAPACAEITVHPLMFKSVSVRPLMRAPVCRLWSQHCAVFICTCEVCNQPCR